MDLEHNYAEALKEIGYSLVIFPLKLTFRMISMMKK